MNRVVNRAGILMIFVALLAVGTLFFVLEYLFMSSQWVMTEGSPHIYTDYSTVCGVITDRNGVLLMDTTEGREYSSDVALRTSTIHWLGDRLGNIQMPIYSYYAAKLTGFDPVNGLYVYGNTNGRVTLTLDARLQKAALKAMGDRKGTIAIYNYKTGQILCAVSTPAYDPNNEPDIAGDTEGLWEGAYINRFLKSTYIPGSIFKIVTSVAALETIENIQQQTFTCTGVVEYGIDKVTCMDAHGEIDFRTAFMRSCNCAFAQIAGQLGGEVLEEYAKQLGITDTLCFDGLQTAPGNIQASSEADVMVAWSAIGQHKDQINVCQFMTLVGSIASGGEGVMPHVVSSIQGGAWGDYTAEPIKAPRIMSRETAAILQEMMRNNVVNYYGEDQLHGFSVCAKSGTAEVGGEKDPNAMFVGFLTDEEYPLAFVITVENGGYGRRVCLPILSSVLEVFKSAHSD